MNPGRTGGEMDKERIAEQEKAAIKQLANMRVYSSRGAEVYIGIEQARLAITLAKRVGYTRQPEPTGKKKCESCGLDIPCEDEWIKAGSLNNPTRYYHESCLSAELESSVEAERLRDEVKYWASKNYKIGNKPEPPQDKPSTANKEAVKQWLMLLAGEGFAKFKRSIPIDFDEKYDQLISLLSPELTLISDEVICLEVCSGCETDGHYLGNIPMCDEHKRLKKSAQRQLKHDQDSMRGK